MEIYKIGDNAPETEAALAAADNASGGDLLAEFGDADAVIVHAIEIVMPSGKVAQLFIKQHSVEDISYIESRRYRKDRSGRVVSDQNYEDVNGIAWEIFMSVVQNEGTAEEPDWKPVFTMEQIKGREARVVGSKVKEPKKRGLIGNPQAGAKDFLNRLMSEIWTVNAELNPTNKAAALQAMTGA